MKPTDIEDELKQAFRDYIKVDRGDRTEAEHIEDLDAQINDETDWDS